MAFADEVGVFVVRGAIDAAASLDRRALRHMGDPASQLHERHDAEDFLTKTQDKLAPAE